ncbi:MAG: lysophospholipase [Alicyclobacillus sp.]|nr:lysophospholipase [Alicyclobacillus sp.]
MQQAVELVHRGRILRGMRHWPSDGHAKAIPAAILYHSFTSTKVEPHRMYVKLSRELERRGVASFRFDFSGSGESDGDFEEMTVSGEVEEAKAILDHVRRWPGIDPDRVSLVGFSLGGLVASLTAGDRPDDVHKLVLIAPAANMPETVRQLAADAGVALPGSGPVRAPAPADIRPQNGAAASGLPPGVFDYGGNLIGFRFVVDVVNLEVFQRASAFRGPVCLIHGTADAAVPADVSRLYQERSYGGRARVHFVEGADHTFNGFAWEREVVQTACEFLAH